MVYCDACGKVVFGHQENCGALSCGECGKVLWFDGFSIGTTFLKNAAGQWQQEGASKTRNSTPQSAPEAAYRLISMKKQLKINYDVLDKLVDETRNKDGKKRLTEESHSNSDGLRSQKQDEGADDTRGAYTNDFYVEN